MARIRSMHPGQWTDEAFVSCSPMARLLAIALRNVADDQGVFEWKPLGLKMQIFPGDSVDVVALLAELSATDQVREYEASGKRYGAIRNFRKWQRPEKPKAVHPIAESILLYVGLSSNASPSQGALSTTEPTSGTVQAPMDAAWSDVDRRPIDDQSPTSRGISIQRKEVGGRREEERSSLRSDLSETNADPSPEPGRATPDEGTPPCAANSPDDGPATTKPRKRAAYPAEFAALWAAYPTDPNMSKSKALEAWKRLDDDDRRACHGVVPAFLDYCRENPRYRPVHLVRFITDRRFDGFAQATATSSTGPASVVASVSDHEWRARVEFYRDTVQWPYGNESPAPDERGCIIPPEILAEFDLGPLAAPPRRAASA